MVQVQRTEVGWTLILSTQQSTLSICNGRCTCTLPAQMETPACPSTQLPDHVHIKPELEACEDLPPPASDAAEDSETTPLSGNPFFTMVMTRTHVHKRFMLCIPARFHHRLPKVRTVTVLLCRGKSWTVDYCGDLKLKRFDAAWMDFAVDNRLRVGDACVFELMTGSTGSESSSKEEGVTFQVQILRGGLPEEVTSKGATSDEPIVIVD